MQNDGLLPLPTKDRGRRSLRRWMVTESVILTVFFWGIGLVATFLFDFGGAFLSINKMAAVMFFLLGLIGLLRFLYAFLFIKENEEHDQKYYREPVTDQRRFALPPPQQTPLSDFPRKPNTKEMVRPISVTENTTRLFDDSEPRHTRED
ncbi:MAG TPA: hypothetical protein VIG25_17395 [Pyrinomonadaceae bacterium]